MQHKLQAIFLYSRSLMQSQKIISALRLAAFFICISFAMHTSAQNQLLVNRSHLGINDTIVVQACVEPNGDTIPCSWLNDAYVFTKMTNAQRKHYAEWTRLRNAVYVTYPYAIAASRVMNDINAQLA